MPTIIFVDVNDPDALDGAQKAAQAFSQAVLEACPLELIAVMASSEGRLIQPFTADLRVLTGAIYSLEEVKLEVEAKGLSVALEAALHQATTTFPVVIGQHLDAPILQVVYISAGRPLEVVGQPPPRLPSFPSTRVHVVLLPNGADVAMRGALQPSKHSDALRNYCHSTRGSFHTAYSAEFNSVKTVIDSVVRVHYPLYEGRLHCGHWSSVFTCHPNPRLINFQEKAALHRFPSEFPTEFSVVGFIPLRILSSPPIVFRFALLPPRTDEKEESLVSAIHETLKGKEEPTAALVSFGDGFYGYVSLKAKQSQTKTHTALILSLMEKDLDLPYVGQLSDLSSVSKRKTVSQLPLRPSKTKSYGGVKFNADIQVPDITSITLASDVTEVIRHLDLLPGEYRNLFNICERIRQKAIVYGLLGVIDVLTGILGKEDDNTSDIHTRKKEILGALKKQLGENKTKPKALKLPIFKSGGETSSTYTPAAALFSSVKPIISVHEDSTPGRTEKLKRSYASAFIAEETQPFEANPYLGVQSAPTKKAKIVDR